ncbi:MAG: DNA-formamidopyrimidine glycosylase family protein [Gemmatimonadota bacterium]|nr:DNA-formamidopyrimidine glycosylase family protein [Gemmatimonadota bacterium]
MPELPDVEVFKEYLDATSLHQRIEVAHVLYEDLLRDVSASTVRRRLKGSELASSRRHGKHLFAEIGDDGWLRLHFGMTGELEYYEDGERPDHAALVLDFPDDNHLAFLNTRRFGEIGLVDDVDAFVEERGLGPDALSDGFDRDDFREALSGRSGTVKSALMNQSRMAGIGNVYADEALFHAGIHPKASPKDLGEETIGELYRTARRVMRRAIEARVEQFPDDFLIPRREEGAECPVCGGEIEKIEVSGRPTYFCGEHQSR